MNNPLVSIIIPAYNMRSYIKSAIESAINQTHKNCEIIVIDDGSTDDTKEILEPYATKGQIKYIFQENKGLAGARNTGIKNAKGEYVALLDADDIFLPNKIERQVDFLEKHPECDVCYCDLWHFYDEEPDKLLKLNYKYYSGDDVFKMLLRKNFINPLTVVCRKSVFERFGYFDEKFAASEDWEYWVRIAKNGVKFYFLPERLTEYRIREGGGSYSLGNEIIKRKTALMIFQKLQKELSFNDKKKYNMRKIILRHRLLLWYAYFEFYFSPLKLIHSWLRLFRLK